MEGENKVVKVLNFFETSCITFCIFALFITLIINVIARTFFTSIYFAEEVSEFLTIFITFVGVSYAARKGRHIRMGALIDLAPKSVEKCIEYFICVASAITMFTMAYFSAEYVLMVFTRAQSSSALRLPFWIFVIIIPLGFFSAGIQYTLTIIKNIKEKGDDIWISPEVTSEYSDDVIEY